MRASVPPTSTIHDIRALFEKDTPTAQCQPWCQPVDDHIRYDGRGAKAHEGARLFYVDERDATKRLHPRSAAASWKKATAITIQIPVVSPAPKRRLVGYDVSPRVARR